MKSKRWFKVWLAITGVALTVALVLTFLPVQLNITSEGMLSIALEAAYAQEPGVIEIIEARSRNSKTYYLGNNQYALDASIGSVHYQDEYGDWQEIDNQWSAAQAPWDWEMLEGGYHTKVLEDFTYGQILLFESQGESVAFQPMALEWTNSLDQIQQISMPQSVAVNVTNEPVELLPGMAGNIGTIRWANGYGTGRHFEWSNTPGRLAKLLTLDGIPPAPEQYIIDGGNPVLRLSFIFDPSPDLDLYVDEVLWNRVTTEQSFNTIEFKKDGEVLWGFMPAAYWDSGGNSTGVGYTELSKSGGKLYVSVRVPYEWLQVATYPVYIDPSVDLQVGANLDDVHERESDGSVYDDASAVYHKSDITTTRYWGAHRWVSGSLPSLGDIITVAYLQLYSTTAFYDDMNGNWHFEKAAASAQFVTGAGADVTSRTRTTASTSWIADALGTGWVQSPSLVTPLQEVIDNYSPTALAAIFRPNTNADKRLYSRAHNSNPSEAAKLHIEWIPAFTARTETYFDAASLGSPYDATVNKPTGTPDDDILFTLVCWAAVGVAIDSTPSGWTKAGDYTASNDKYALYYKIASSEGASYTWSFDGSCRVRLVCSCYTGGDFDAADPIDVVSNTAYRTGSTTVRAASMTVSAANSPLVFFGVLFRSSAASFTKPSVPTTDWVEDDDAGSTVSDFWSEVCSMIWSGSGATGDMDATSSWGTAKHAFAVALNPAAEEPEITNIPSSNDFGILAVSTTGSTAINYFTIENTGNCAADVVIYGTDVSGGDDTWDLSDTATPGENIYGLYAGLDDDDDIFDVIVRETETYNTLLTDLAEDATQDWGLKIYMPTSVTDYDAQQMSGTVTLVASAS